jgi:6-phosphogluconolactonase
VDVSKREITCFRDMSELIEGAARIIVDGIRARIETVGKCYVSLSGGSTPKPVYERLAKPDLADQIDWAKVYISFGDERCVPPDHPESNFRMARVALLDHLPIPVRNITRIQGELEPHQAADLFTNEIAYRKQDIVILGLGFDGHAASLFPNSAGLDAPSKWVVVTESGLQPTMRVSIAFRVINAARTVIFLVAGKKKAGILAKVFQEREMENPKLPAAMVRPTSGSLTWLVDYEAVGKLDLNLAMGETTSF